MKKILTPEDVATEYGIPLSTQSKRRMAGTFCPYIKNGRSVLYRREALEQWLDENTFTSTPEAKPVSVRGR